MLGKYMLNISPNLGRYLTRRTYAWPHRIDIGITQRKKIVRWISI